MTAISQSPRPVVRDTKFLESKAAPPKAGLPAALDGARGASCASPAAKALAVNSAGAFTIIGAGTFVGRGAMGMLHAYAPAAAAWTGGALMVSQLPDIWQAGGELAGLVVPEDHPKLQKMLQGLVAGGLVAVSVAPAGMMAGGARLLLLSNLGATTLQVLLIDKLFQKFGKHFVTLEMRSPEGHPAAPGKALVAGKAALEIAGHGLTWHYVGSPLIDKLFLKFGGPAASNPYVQTAMLTGGVAIAVGGMEGMRAGVKVVLDAGGAVLSGHRLAEPARPAAAPRAEIEGDGPVEEDFEAPVQFEEYARQPAAEPRRSAACGELAWAAVCRIASWAVTPSPGSLLRRAVAVSNDAAVNYSIAFGVNAASAQVGIPAAEATMALGRKPPASAAAQLELRDFHAAEPPRFELDLDPLAPDEVAIRGRS
jgi:hypothetical protein